MSLTTYLRVPDRFPTLAALLPLSYSHDMPVDIAVSLPNYSYLLRSFPLLFYRLLSMLMASISPSEW